MLIRGESVIGYSKSQGGDILNYYDLKEAMKSCDRVIHLAGCASFSNKDIEVISRLNIIGTGNVLMAAELSGIKKVVFISSAITCGVSPKADFLISEQCAMLGDTIKNKDMYTYSKIEGEKLCRIIPHKEGGICVSIANPSTATVPMVIDNVRRRKILIAPPGGTNVIDVRDVADGIIAILDNGKHAEQYILSNVNITYKDLFEKISGRRAIVLPKWSIRMAKYLARYAKDKYTSPFTVMNSYFYKYYSNSKAKNELNWEPKISLEDMLK